MHHKFASEVFTRYKFYLGLVNVMNDYDVLANIEFLRSARTDVMSKQYYYCNKLYVLCTGRKNKSLNRNFNVIFSYMFRAKIIRLLQISTQTSKVLIRFLSIELFSV